MSALAVAFDSFEYCETLKEAGVSDTQAKAHAMALQKSFKAYDEKNREELATKGDLRETELRLQKEIETVRKEIQQVKYDLLKWQIAGWATLATIMAKGFHWF